MLRLISTLDRVTYKNFVTEEYEMNLLIIYLFCFRHISTFEFPLFDFFSQAAIHCEFRQFYGEFEKKNSPKFVIFFVRHWKILENLEMGFSVQIYERGHDACTLSSNLRDSFTYMIFKCGNRTRKYIGATRIKHFARKNNNKSSHFRAGNGTIQKSLHRRTRYAHFIYIYMYIWICMPAYIQSE